VRARVRTRQIYIEIRGIIPAALMQILREEYGHRLTMRAEWGEHVRNVNAGLYQREPKEMTPGAALRFFRQDNGLTQMVLGRYFGVSRQNVSHMENGRRPISRKMALRLSRFFRVGTDKFIG
jgi:DNA-binding XRE family transcriptional regulator